MGHLLFPTAPAWKKIGMDANGELKYVNYNKPSKSYILKLFYSQCP